MKKIIPLLIIIMLPFIFTSCGCDHQYKEKTTKTATCITNGEKTYTCTLCNDYYTEETPLGEHSYESAITKKATCAEKGITTFTCSLCKDSYTEDIEMVPHTFENAKVTKKPTCTVEGEKSSTCKVCKKTEITEKISVIDHEFVDTVTKKATCTTNGEITPTCKCGKKGTPIKTNKTQHKYTEEIIVLPTYKTTGQRKYTCINCNDSYTENIEKLSAYNILSKTQEGSSYITDALNYMNTALKHYKNGKHSSGQSAVANMLVKTGYAINQFQTAYNLCENHSDLNEIKSLLSNTISELEYVKQYTSVSTYDYYDIAMDIYYKKTYQNVTNYENQLISLFSELS